MSGVPSAGPDRHADRRLTFVMCGFQVLSLLGVSVFPALLPGFVAEWGLTGSQGGWLNGVFFAGFMVSAPVLLVLTDRVDARSVILFGAALGALVLGGFAVFADGFASALVLRALLGVSFAATYMPGMKVLTDRLTGPDPSRAVSFYVASYLLGTAASYDLAGRIDAVINWHWAFGLTAIGPVLAGGLVAALVGSRPAPLAHEDFAFPDFRPILRNRTARAYMASYALHNWELMAAGSWMVAYLTFAATQQSDGAVGWNLTLIAALATLAALPASVLGNEIAMRAGRARTVAGIMVLSGLVGWGVGFASGLPFALVVGLVVVYGMLNVAESASVTAGAIMAVPVEMRGAAMAVHSFVGFGGAFAGPLVFGAVLDIAGGGANSDAWGAAYVVCGAGAILGPVALWVFGGRDLFARATKPL